MTKRNKALIIILILLTLTPFNSSAQELVKFSNFRIELWPEYDQPSMLVIYRGILSPEVELPTDVTIRIPASVGEPNAVAVGDTTGSLFNATYTIEAQGAWALITFTATLPEIQIEYYDDSLKFEGSNRKFTYRWPGDYTVDAATLIVQQPIGASNMQTPYVGTSTQDGSGLVYYSTDLGSLPAGVASEDITIEYTKPSNTLSVESLAVQPGTNVTQETSGRVNLPQMIPWGVGVLGLLILAGGIYWYWMSGRQAPKEYTRPPRKRHKPQAAFDDGEPEETRYCHQCGKRAGASDRFCRSCGTKLR